GVPVCEMLPGERDQLVQDSQLLADGGACLVGGVQLVHQSDERLVLVVHLGDLQTQSGRVPFKEAAQFVSRRSYRSTRVIGAWSRGLRVSHRGGHVVLS